MKKFLITILILFSLAYPVFATQISSIVNQGVSPAVRLPNQGFGFYAAGRYWVFFLNTTYDFQFKTSTDNVNWSSATTIQNSATYINAAMHDVYFDSSNVHYIRNGVVNGSNYDFLYYRKGVPETNGTITWAAAEQTIIGGNPYNHANDISLTVDSSGYPWVGMQYGTSAGYGNAYITKSNTNDGTWTTASGYPKLLYSTPANNWLTKVVAQTGGKVYALLYSTTGVATGTPTTYAYPIKGMAYNGTDWGSLVEVTASYLNNFKSGGYYGQFDATAIGDDIHLVFKAVTTNDIRYVKYTNGAWGVEEILVPTSYTEMDSSPVIMKWNDTTLYMFWIKKPVIYYLINQGGIWDTTVKTFLTDLNIAQDDEHSLQVFDEPYSVGGILNSGLFYQPTISSLRQQTFVSYTSLTEEIPPPGDPPSGIGTARTVFGNNVVFKNNVVINN